MNILFSIIKRHFQFTSELAAISLLPCGSNQESVAEGCVHVSGNGRCKSCQRREDQALLGIFEHLGLKLKLIEFL